MNLCSDLSVWNGSYNRLAVIWQFLETGILGYDSLYKGRQEQTFVKNCCLHHQDKMCRRNLLLPSSEPIVSKQSKALHDDIKIFLQKCLTVYKITLRHIETLCLTPWKELTAGPVSSSTFRSNILPPSSGQIVSYVSIRLETRSEKWQHRLGTLAWYSLLEETRRNKYALDTETALLNNQLEEQ